MIDDIIKCKKCPLYKNQKPLLDTTRKADVFFVGLSAKKIKEENEIPLSSSTSSGKLIYEIEKDLANINFYKTNITKCVPLANDKIRYPFKDEINTCIDHLFIEINELKPKIVFLLGDKVTKSVGNKLSIKFDKYEDYNFKYIIHNNIYYIPVYHPSYIQVYKKKYKKEYIENIQSLIKTIIK